jgi:hypothetical protein
MVQAASVYFSSAALALLPRLTVAAFLGAGAACFLDDFFAFF